MGRYERMSREELLRELLALAGKTGGRVGLSESGLYDSRPGALPRDEAALADGEAPVALCELDAHAIVEDANAAAEALLGAPREKLVSRSLLEVLGARDPVAFRKHFRDCLAARAALTARLELARPAGPRSVLCIGTARREGDEPARGARMALVDVSELVAAHDETRGVVSEHRRRIERLEALERASAALHEALLDSDARVVETILERLAEHARALTDARLAAAALAGPAHRPFAAWVQVGLPAEEARQISGTPRPTGVLRAVAFGATIRERRVRSHPAFSGTPANHPELESFLGVPVRACGRTIATIFVANKKGAAAFTAEDQTAIEELAARGASALRLAKARRARAAECRWLEGALERMPTPVLLADDRGRVRANAAARSLALVAEPAEDGAAREGFAMRARAASGAVLPASATPLARALAEERVENVELLVDAPDGRHVTVSASAASVPLGGGRRGAVAVLHDITAFKTIARLREKWVSVVAHELRQPLGSMLIMLGALGRGRDGRETDTLGRMRAQVARLNRMIDDLLDKARIDSGKVKVALEPVDVAKLAPEIIERARALTAGCSVRLEVPGGEPLRVAADPGRIEQVLLNLLSNAAKYGCPGGEIAVSAERRDDEVVLSVTNGGRGLTRDECARVFDREYRTTASEESDVSGLGLGLYIARGLVEAQGGRIWVDSQPGGPTTFSLALPRQGARRR